MHACRKPCTYFIYIAIKLVSALCVAIIICYKASPDFRCMHKVIFSVRPVQNYHNEHTKFNFGMLIVPGNFV